MIHRCIQREGGGWGIALHAISNEGGCMVERYTHTYTRTNTHRKLCMQSAMREDVWWKDDVYVHTHTHRYTRTYMHANTQIQTHTDRFACHRRWGRMYGGKMVSNSHALLVAGMYVYVCVCVWICAWVWMYVHGQWGRMYGGKMVSTYTHAYTCTHMHVYVSTYTHTHICMYTRACIYMMYMSNLHVLLVAGMYMYVCVYVWICA